MLYNYFPSSIYQNTLVTDILRKFKISDRAKKSTIVENYRVREEDTPESLAHLLYKDTRLAWMILMLNDIKDRHNEWPYTYSVLSQKIENKYATSALYFYDSDFSQTLPITKINTITVDGELLEIDHIDPNFNKIVTKQKLSSNINTSTDLYLTFKGYNILGIKNPRRVVYEDKFSLHHFEDADGIWIDPRSSILPNSEYTEQGSYLYHYINSENLGADVEQFVVTNQDYEYKTNDDKRDIILLQPEYKDQLISKINRIFQNTNKDSNVLEMENELFGDISA